MRPATVAYREAIRKQVEVEGKHAKQSGGRQYGQCLDQDGTQRTGQGLRICRCHQGGTVPREYIPAVDKGCRKP